MTIDEAIAHEREVAEIHRNNDKLNKTLGKSSPYYNTDCIKCAEEQEQLADWLEELKQYRAIGTIEECREAVDKMKPKKTAIEAIKVHICPVCGFGGIYDYCGNCGQRVQMLSD